MSESTTPALSQQPAYIVIEGDTAIVTLSRAYTHATGPSVVKLRSATAGDDIQASAASKTGSYSERIAHLLSKTICDVDGVLPKVEYGFVCNLLKRDFARLEEAQARLDYPLGEEA